MGALGPSSVQVHPCVAEEGEGEEPEANPLLTSSTVTRIEASGEVTLAEVGMGTELDALEVVVVVEVEQGVEAEAGGRAGTGPLPLPAPFTSGCQVRPS